MLKIIGRVMELKHIIIAGCSRTGKTTLSMRFKEMGYTHYKMDTIKRGIYNNFCSNKNDDWKNISPKMAHLIATIINECNSDKIKDILNRIIISTILTLHLKKYIKFESSENQDGVIVLIQDSNEKLKNTVIVFLGYTDLNKNDKLLNIRKYDSDNIWTSSKSDKEILDNIELGIKYSKEVKKQCNNLKIPYFDTSKNFNKVLNNVYNYIKNEINDEV